MTTLLVILSQWNFFVFSLFVDKKLDYIKMFYYGMCVSLTLYHDLVIYDYVMLCNAWQPVYNPVITHSRPLSGSRPTVWELLLCAVCQVFLSGDLGLLLMLVAMVTDSIRSGLWVVKCDECGKKSYVVLNDLTLMNVITSQPFFSSGMLFHARNLDFGLFMG